MGATALEGGVEVAAVVALDLGVEVERGGDEILARCARGSKLSGRARHCESFGLTHDVLYKPRRHVVLIGAYGDNARVGVLVLVERRAQQSLSLCCREAYVEPTARYGG